MWQRLWQSPDWRFVALTLVVFVLFQLVGEAPFRFQQDWHSSGEAWRLFTAHWVHVGWAHLGLNITGLVICVMLARPNWSLRRWFGQSLCMALGISLLVTAHNPEVFWYVGFSGVLFGLYFLAAHDLYARDRLIALLMGGAIVLKVLLEQYTPWEFTSSELIGAPVIVDAHKYGLLIAVAIALVWSTYTMNHGPSETSN